MPRKPKPNKPQLVPAQQDAAFWSRLRSSVARIEDLTQSLLTETVRTGRSRYRLVLEVIGGAIAVAGLALALIGLFQNAVGLQQNASELAGLRDSLQREEVESAFSIGGFACGDPDTDTVTSAVSETYLTNVGRLPITVMHVGDGSDFVNDFAYVRVDEQPTVVRRGPFYLDVGQAVAVSFGATRPEFSSAVTLRLSDGSTVVTKSAGGDEKWLVFTDIREALFDANVQCPSGVGLAAPLSQLTSDNPDYEEMTPPSDSPFVPNE